MRCSVLAIFDADRAPAREKNAARQRVRGDSEIGAAPGLAQISERRRAAPAVAGGELKIAGAFLARSVEIVIARKSRLLRRRDEGIAQGMRRAHIRDGKRTADA